MLYPIGKENDVYDDLFFTYTLDVTPVLVQIEKASLANKEVLKKCLTKHLNSLFNICEYDTFVERIGDDLMDMFYRRLYSDEAKAMEMNTTLDEGDVEQILLSDLGDELEELYHNTAENLRKDLEDFLKSKGVDLSEYTVVSSESLTSDEFNCYYLLKITGLKMSHKMQSYIQYLIDKDNS